jgi:integrase
MASLRKKPKSKFWIACYTDSTGRQRQRSTGLTDRRLALKFAEQLEDAHRNRIAEDAARRAFESLVREIHGAGAQISISVREVADLWLKSKRLETSMGTFARYEGLCRHWLEYLGTAADSAVAAVSSADIERYRNAVAAKRSRASVNMALKIVRGLMQYAFENGWIARNPASTVRQIKRKAAGDQAKRRPFTVAELQSLLAAADGEWRGIILAGLYTGQRLGDVANLRWSEVDLVSGEISILADKGDRRTIIPIHPALARHLMGMTSSDDPTAPLFPESRRTVLRAKNEKTSTLSNQFTAIMVRAGLRTIEKKPHRKGESGEGRSTRRTTSELSFHSLRHTATSLMKRAGAASAVVQDIIGHESEAVSLNYTKIDSASKATAINLMPDITAAP